MDIQLSQSFAGNVKNDGEGASSVQGITQADANLKVTDGQKNELGIKSIGREDKSAQVVANSADTLEDRSLERLNEAVLEIETFLNSQNRELLFSIDDGSNRPVVIVKDSGSGDVIRQIPSDEALELANKIRDLQTDIGQSVGMFIDKQV